MHLLAQNTVAEVVPETASQDESVTSSENKVLDSSVEAVEITDVRDFKAGVPLSEGLKAVKDITEFEELEAKL